MSLTKPSSPSDIETHEEKIVLFWDDEHGENWFEDPFESILSDIESRVDPDKLSITLRPGGMNRKLDRPGLLFNSMWAVREECLLENRIFKKEFLPYFANMSIPKETKVVYCVKNESDMEKAKKRMNRICENAICVNSKDELIGAAQTYFASHNPDRGPVGQKRIFEWYDSVWQLLENYD